jgi:hypothetical protein
MSRADRTAETSGRSGLIARAAGAGLMAIALAASLIAGIPASEAALIQGTSDSEVIIGPDDDNQGNEAIHPPGTAADQSLRNTDLLFGARGHDILVGRLGNDVLDGGEGDDILIGGPEGGVAPNSDIMFGGAGNDIAIWAPGDGSDAFIGGRGRDALIFGLIDRDPADNSLPLLSGPTNRYPHGLPSTNVSGSPGFCTLEEVEDPSFGFDFLVRFFVRATGNLAVTIRILEVEHVFCTSQGGGQITFADLTRANPQFVVVTPAQVQRLNPDVARIIR